MAFLMIFGDLNKWKEKKPHGSLLSFLLIFLALSFTPFNLSDVDKTGLRSALDNYNDKLFRLFWFFVGCLILIFKKPAVLVFFCYRNHWLLLLTLLYLLILIFSAGTNALGVVAYYRILEYLFLIAGIFFTNLIIRVHGRSSAVMFFSTVIWQTAFVISMVLGIGLLIDVDHFYALEAQGRFRLGGFAYSPNLLGMILTLGSLSSIYLFTRENSTAKRTVLVATILLFTIGLWYTGSRTAQISFLISICFWKFLKLTVKSKLVILFLATIFLFVTFILLKEEVFYFIAKMMGKGHSPIYDILTLNNRSVVFFTGLEGALDNWVFGVGFVEGVKEFYRNNFSQSYWMPPHSHNSLLESFLSSGIFGLLFFLVIYGFLFGKLIFEIFHKNTSDENYLLVLFVPLILASLTMVVFGGIYSVLTLWYFCAFLLIMKPYEK